MPNILAWLFWQKSARPGFQYIGRLPKIIERHIIPYIVFSYR